jgi:hypothetical protein
MKKLFLVTTLAIVAVPISLSATTIDAKTNIFVAGQDSTGINTMGGLFPAVAQTFLPGPGQSITFNVTPGPLSASAGPPGNAAGFGDGATMVFPFGPTTGTDIDGNGINGISGIQFTGREMFLVGVFLDNSVPTGAGPAKLSFSSTGGTYNMDTDTAFTAFALGQVFAIGDGKTGFNNAAGSLQTWQVPTGATRLFLGFADAFNNFTGPWGAYGDNSGSIDVAVNVMGQQQNPSSVPESTSTLVLLGLSITGLALFQRRQAMTS